MSESLQNEPGPGYTVKGWGKSTTVSRTKIYELIKQGEIEARKLGGRTIIVTQPTEWLAKLPKVAA